MSSLEQAVRVQVQEGSGSGGLGFRVLCAKMLRVRVCSPDVKGPGFRFQLLGQMSQTKSLSHIPNSKLQRRRVRACLSCQDMLRVFLALPGAPQA